MKQAIKKKNPLQKPSISSIKEKLGLVSSKTNRVVSSADKPQEFIVMPEAFVEATKLPGIPMGVTTLIHGHSNTGKSLLKNCLIASAQRQGILPVIIETENNFSFKFAISCGMQATPIYDEVEVEKVDPETGEITIEVEDRVVEYEGNFLYYDSEILVEKYGDFDHSQGKRVSKRRTEPVIEDIAMLMHELLDMQANGDIQQPLLFIWDSVGSISSFRSVTSRTTNAMWDAGALSVAFNTLLNNRIPSSKKISSPYTNTFVAVNKVWLDSMTSPVGPPSLQMKGGNALLYSSRLTILLGGTLKAATKKLNATSKGETYTYGLITKIKIIKNQLDSPYGLTYEGTFCCVPNGMVSEDRLDEYKKNNVSLILKELQELAKGKDKVITAEDIEFNEEDSEE